MLPTTDPETTKSLDANANARMAIEKGLEGFQVV
jgi:hypothetical protein